MTNEGVDSQPQVYWNNIGAHIFKRMNKFSDWGSSVRHHVITNVARHSQPAESLPEDTQSASSHICGQDFLICQADKMPCLHTCCPLFFSCRSCKFLSLSYQSILSQSLGYHKLVCSSFHLVTTCLLYAEWLTLMPNHLTVPRNVRWFSPRVMSALFVISHSYAAAFASGKLDAVLTIAWETIPIHSEDRKSVV